MAYSSNTGVYAGVWKTRNAGMAGTNGNQKELEAAIWKLGAHAPQRPAQIYPAEK